MITGELAPSAWRVQKVFPLANRSSANFPLPCSLLHLQAGVTDSHSRTAGLRMFIYIYPPRNCTLMPKSLNAGPHLKYYSS